jgi:hypothetical protein
MAELTREAYKAAKRQGEIDMSTKPRARAAHYDRESRRLIIELTNGSTFAFDPRLAQGLENAADEQLGCVQTSPAGFGLHWEELDVDLSVEGLLAGRFGSRRYMAERFGAAWDAQAAE